jgi:hypothetical protein
MAAAARAWRLGWRPTRCSACQAGWAGPGRRLHCTSPLAEATDRPAAAHRSSCCAGAQQPGRAQGPQCPPGPCCPGGSRCLGRQRPIIVPPPLIPVPHPPPSDCHTPPPQSAAPPAGAEQVAAAAHLHKRADLLLDGHLRDAQQQLLVCHRVDPAAARARRGGRWWAAAPDLHMAGARRLHVSVRAPPGREGGVAGGGWRVAGGGWRVAGGGWRVGGGWQPTTLAPAPASGRSGL